MIKLAVIFCLVSVAFAMGVTVPAGSILKSIRSAVDDCYEDDEKTIKVKYTEEAFMSLITNDPNAPRSTKCMRYCVMEMHHLFNDDGTLNIIQMQNILKVVYPNIVRDTELNSVAESIEKCMAVVTAGDRCDGSHDAVMCMISNLADRGVNLRKVSPN